METYLEVDLPDDFCVHMFRSFQQTQRPTSGEMLLISGNPKKIYKMTTEDLCCWIVKLNKSN